MDSDVRRALQSAKERLGHLLVLEFVNTLNEGFCRRHLARCPGVRSDPLFMAECVYAERNGEDIRKEVLRVGTPGPERPDSLCEDERSECGKWKAEGKCYSWDGATSVGRCCKLQCACALRRARAACTCTPERSLDASWHLCTQAQARARRSRVQLQSST
jgi:hypothetical protein